MQLIKPRPDVFYFRFNDQYETASTFVRIQEFYESPYEEIRNKYFTLESYMDIYAKNSKKGNFTYFTDCSGFNIPGHVIVKFFWKYLFRFRSKEWNLLKQIPVSMLLGLKKFYVIGLFRNEDFQHEYSHALYYLEKTYKIKMMNLIDSLPKKEYDRWHRKLIKIGYCEDVIHDEIQAHEIDLGTKRFCKVYESLSGFKTN